MNGLATMTQINRKNNIMKSPLSHLTSIKYFVSCFLLVVFFVTSCEKDNPGSGSKEIKKETVNFFEVNGDTTCIDHANQNVYSLGVFINTDTGNFKNYDTNIITGYNNEFLLYPDSLEYNPDEEVFIGEGSVFYFEIKNINKNLQAGSFIYNDTSAEIYCHDVFLYKECRFGIGCDTIYKASEGNVSITEKNEMFEIYFLFKTEFNDRISGFYYGPIDRNEYLK